VACHKNDLSPWFRSLKGLCDVHAVQVGFTEINIQEVEIRARILFNKKKSFLEVSRRAYDAGRNPVVFYAFPSRFCGRFQHEEVIVTDDYAKHIYHPHDNYSIFSQVNQPSP